MPERIAARGRAQGRGPPDRALWLRLRTSDIVQIVADSLPLRIFLASPADVEAERQVVRVCVNEHNCRRRANADVTYEVVGWERVRGTARRPQEAINELIAESHFLIALFKASWGSEPGSPWGYTSGKRRNSSQVCWSWAKPSGPCVTSGSPSLTTLRPLSRSSGSGIRCPSITR